MSWKITYDAAKRQQTLAKRCLDFADAPLIFSGMTADYEDERVDYGEVRMITVGHLRDRMVILVWTQRDDARHIISMRKANERERRDYGEQLGRPG